MAQPSAPADAPARFERVAAPPAGAPVPAFRASHGGLWDAQRYMLRQKTLSLGRTYFIEDDAGRPLAYCKGTILKLKAELRVYADESRTRELLLIRQRQILDALGSFEVVDSATGAAVGSVSRQYWRSWVRDEWILHDAERHEVARVKEESLGMAILTRLPYVGLFVPKRMLLFGPGERALADFRRRLWSLGKWSVDLSGDPQRTLDRRLVLATLILMEAVEQQHNVQF